MDYPQIGSLHEAITSECSEVRRHPIFGRRVANVTTVVLSEDPDILGSPVLQERVRARYKQVYGSPIIIAILLQVLISISAKLVADWILKWWQERQDRRDETHEDDEVRGLIAVLGSQAQREIEADLQRG